MLTPWLGTNHNSSFKPFESLHSSKLYYFAEIFHGVFEMEKIRRCTVFLVVLVMTGAYSVNQEESRTLPENDSETIANLRQEIDNKRNFIDEQKSYINKTKKLIKKMVIEKTNVEKNSVRQKFLENRSRLIGIGDYPGMEEGSYFKKLAKRLEKIRTELEEIKRQMEVLLKKRPLNSGTRRKRSQQYLWSLNRTEITFLLPEAVPDSYTPQDYYIAHEILQFELRTLKEEEADLLLQKKKLENESRYHLLEQARISQEDALMTEYTLLNERYLLLTLLGEGRFAVVYKAFDLKEQRYVACKVHNLTDRWYFHADFYINETIQEYYIQRALNHSRIVKSYDAFEIDKATFCTVLEYCDGGDLMHYMKQRGRLPEKEAKLIMIQLVSALKYLNEIKPRVVHGDLRSDNILLMGEPFSGEIKITDFDLSILQREQNTEYDNSSPENLAFFDIFYFGRIFYECLYGTPPEIEEELAFPNTPVVSEEAKELEFPNTPVVSEEAKSIIRSCLVTNLTERIDVLTLAQHQYFQPPVPEHGL